MDSCGDVVGADAVSPGLSAANGEDTLAKMVHRALDGGDPVALPVVLDEQEGRQSKVMLLLEPAELTTAVRSGRSPNQGHQCGAPSCTGEISLVAVGVSSQGRKLLGKMTKEVSKCRL